VSHVKIVMVSTNQSPLTLVHQSAVPPSKPTMGGIGSKPLSDADVEAVFKSLDSNETGSVSATELKVCPHRRKSVESITHLGCCFEWKDDRYKLKWVQEHNCCSLM
jgi:hypothetical protein